MDVMATAGSAPDLEQYCSDAALAGPFENRILYAVCRDHPRHDDPYVTAGKITAIGRIYAAAPERGAGTGRSPGSLADAIAARLSRSSLDEELDAIHVADRFSSTLLECVVAAHGLLVAEAATATREWSLASESVGWSPRVQASFASKYLHFHRPNAFPILDRYAKAGLTCAGLAGNFDTYERFCGGFARHVADHDPDWTPRGVDTGLVLRGRAHSDRSGSHCRLCGTEFIRRPRKKRGE